MVWQEREECTQLFKNIVEALWVRLNQDLQWTTDTLHDSFKTLDSSKLSATAKHDVWLAKNRAITYLIYLDKIFKGDHVDLPKELHLSEDDILTDCPAIEGSYGVPSIDNVKFAWINRKLGRIVKLMELVHVVHAFYR
jgi:hypothetical protein